MHEIAESAQEKTPHDLIQTSNKVVAKEWRKKEFKKKNNFVIIINSQNCSMYFLEKLYRRALNNDKKVTM